MCGICGVYRFDQDEPVDAGHIEVMKSLLVHRGPDEDGTHVEPRIGLGHRRLSIIGLSTGRQPLSNETGTVWVTFNGEIYNYRELREKLLGRGHQFKTNADTEVLVHLYEEEGLDFVNQLRGMFAIGLWDRDKQRLVLARDRLGKKPLYYYANDRFIAFASEIKAILSYREVPRTPNLQALHHYMSLAYVPAPLTAFEGVASLPGGHTLVASGGKTDVRRYWDIEFRPEERPLDQLEEELDEAFDEAVRIRLESEVPLGVFLSGGVDSSAVAQRMSRQLERQLISTTIRFDDPRYDESASAAKLAAVLGTEHHVRDVGPGSTAIIEQLLWHFDEPFADSSALPTYFLCKAARESLTVALSGDGGDEMFAGYDRYTQVAREESLRSRIPAVLRKLLLPLGAIYPHHARGRTFLDNLNLPPGEAAFNTFTHFGHRDKSALYTAEMRSFLAEGLRTSELFRSLYECCRDPSPITRVQYVDYKSYLVDDILVKVDRMSMAHSLEVRSPLLDHKLVELVATYPVSAKLHQGRSKLVFKKMLERHLPREVLYRPKQGFTVPLAAWFRGELKQWVQDVVFDGSLARRGYFNSEFLESLWRIQQAGGRQHVDLGTHFWILLMLELWHRTYIDSEDFLRMGQSVKRH
jgi:asparagine synthase (glutamine-hydrolysing)